MMVFPSSLVTLRVLIVRQGIVQASVFVLSIDCPLIGLEINNCQIPSTLGQASYACQVSLPRRVKLCMLSKKGCLWLDQREIQNKGAFLAEFLSLD